MNIDALNDRTRRIVHTTDYKVALAIEQLTNAMFQIMEDQDISKAQLAARLGKSRAWVGKVLSGEQNMTIRTAVTLLNELGYDIDFEVYEQWNQADHVDPQSTVIVASTPAAIEPAFLTSYSKAA